MALLLLQGLLFLLAQGQAGKFDRDLPSLSEWQTWRKIVAMSLVDKAAEKFQLRLDVAMLVIQFSERSRSEGRMEQVERINRLVMSMGHGMSFYLKRRRKQWRLIFAHSLDTNHNP